MHVRMQRAMRAVAADKDDWMTQPKICVPDTDGISGSLSSIIDLKARDNTGIGNILLQQFLATNKASNLEH